MEVDRSSDVGTGGEGQMQGSSARQRWGSEPSLEATSLSEDKSQHFNPILCSGSFFDKSIAHICRVSMEVKPTFNQVERCYEDHCSVQLENEQCRFNCLVELNKSASNCNIH